MKLILIFFLLIKTGFIIAQDIPEFISDTTSDTKINSLILKNVKPSYDQVISYTTECYWPTEQLYFVLGSNKGKWELFRLQVKYKNRDKSIENIKSIRKNKLRVDSMNVYSLFTLWKETKFWNLNNDSLKFTYKSVDGKQAVYIISTDGCSDRFEIITKDKYKLNEVYNIDELQQAIPTTQRDLFIQGRNKFIQLIDRK